VATLKLLATVHLKKAHHVEVSAASFEKIGNNLEVTHRKRVLHRKRFAQNRSASCCNKWSSDFDRSDYSAQALEQHPPSKISCLRFHSRAVYGLTFREKTIGNATTE